MKITIPAFTQLFAIMLVGILSGCTRGPMPPNKESADKVADRIQEAGKNVTEKEVEDGKASDEGKKALVNKMIVEPFERAGYDLNATLEDFAVRLRDKNFTQDEGEVIMLVMSIYGEQAEDLAHFGFISDQTLKDLDKVYKNSRVRDAEAAAAAAQKKLEDAKSDAASANAQAERAVAEAKRAFDQVTANQNLQYRNREAEGAESDVALAKSRYDKAVEDLKVVKDLYRNYAEEEVKNCAKTVKEKEEKYQSKLEEVEAYKTRITEEAAKVLEDAKMRQAETAKALQIATEQAAANAAK